MSSAEKLRLYCYILGRPDYPFHIEVDRTKDVSDLREAIYIKGQVKGVRESQLNLWKHYISDSTDKTELEKLRLNDEDALTTTESLSIFSDAPWRHIHVIVQAPLPPPATPPFTLGSEIIKRFDTVVGICQRLLTNALIQFRGSPASGKSVLATLLYEYLQQHYPTSNVVFLSWNESTDWRGSLISKCTELPGPEILNFLIVDEAQGSYNDVMFWQFLKSLNRSSDHRVILFCSYGSPTSHTYEIPTLMVMGTDQRISLQPTKSPNGFAPLGLLLTRSEFDDLVQKSFSASKLDESFRQTIFKVTAGHVGAIVDFLHFIKKQGVYRRVKNTNECITLERFLEETTYHSFITEVVEQSLFIRGLPSREELQDPSLATVLRTVLRNHSVTDQSFKEKDQQQALQTCYRRGWLHSDLISGSQRVQYFFTSPLHQMFIENYLYGPMDVPIRETTLQEFVITICHKMSPVNFRSERKVGAAHIQRTPEAQYGDEFYRSCMNHTEGSVITLSEFGTKDGRIDFYLASKRWGIEILRDGIEISAHNNRFTSGAFLKWIIGREMEDYIMLDFCQNEPRATYPNMRLWHVCFKSDDGSIQILDNMLRRVCPPFVLLV